MDTRLLASIIDLLPDATFAIDKDGKVIAWNRAIEIMTGVKREEMLNKGDYIYAIPFYGVRRPILIDLVFKIDMEAEASYDYVKKNKTAIFAEAFVPILNEGKGAYLWGTAAPIIDEYGNYEGAIESIRDITMIKEAKDALKVLIVNRFDPFSANKFDPPSWGCNYKVMNNPLPYFQIF